VSRDCGDLRFRRPHEGKPRHCGTAQVVECYTDDSGLGPRLSEGRAEPVGRPRLALGGEQDDWTQAWLGVQRGLERSANRYDDARAGLALLEPNCIAVIRGPS
jgi:hypothetical protein